MERTLIISRVITVNTTVPMTSYPDLSDSAAVDFEESRELAEIIEELSCDEGVSYISHVTIVGDK